MRATMKPAGPRKIFSLSGPPPKLYVAKRQKKRAVVPIFEPYHEALPLESGFYTYVLDSRGRLRVERGNTSSHAGMVGGEPVGAAGNFWISRAGKLGRVACVSHNYGFFIPHERHPTVQYVIDSFCRHQAFDVSPYAVFTFSRGIADSFRVSIDGNLLVDDAEHQRLLEEEGQGESLAPGFSAAQLEAFHHALAFPPPRLYAMKLDHQQDPIDFDSEGFDVGPAKPPFSPADGPLRPGRKAFVLDDMGRLIVGYGHHLLSGGNPVAAAGQLHVDQDGKVSEISLNFSGHYRPPLSAEYARYTYRSLIAHPLLTISDDCRISARKSFDLATSLETLVFTPEELTSDDPALDIAIDNIRDESVFDQDLDSFDDGNEDEF